MIENLEIHTYCNIFPFMAEEEFEKLVNDIKLNGQQERILTFKNKIIDGRNRLNACKKLNIEPKYNEWDGKEENLLTFIISKNLHRRHLTATQKAIVSQKILPLLEEEANKRRIEGNRLGGQNSTKNDVKITENKFSQKIEPTYSILNENKSTEHAAKVMGVNRQYISDVKKINKESPKVFEKMFEGKLNIPEAKQIIKLPIAKQEEVLTTIATQKKPNIRKVVQEIKNKDLPIPELPKDKFNVILADPPWEYEFTQSNSREIENQYPTMTLEQIKNINIPSSENSVLLLWATAPKLIEALEVMKVWGFTYKTNAIWDKVTMGMGYWFRNRHELLLIGTKGHFSPPLPENRIESVIVSKRENHSKKPEIVYEIIKKMFPNGKYLEMFARNNRNNWKSWGNQNEQLS